MPDTRCHESSIAPPPYEKSRHPSPTVSHLLRPARCPSNNDTPSANLQLSRPPAPLQRVRHPSISCSCFIPLVPTIPTARSSVLRGSRLSIRRATLPPRDSRSVTPQSVLLLTRHRLHLLLLYLSLHLSIHLSVSFPSYRRCVCRCVSHSHRFRLCLAFPTSAACANVRVRLCRSCDLWFLRRFPTLSASTVPIRSPSFATRYSFAALVCSCSCSCSCSRPTDSRGVDAGRLVSLPHCEPQRSPSRRDSPCVVDARETTNCLTIATFVSPVFGCNVDPCGSEWISKH